MTDVMTVLGPIPESKLGITLAHEHVFLDLSCLWHQPLDQSRMFLVDAPISLENRGLLVCDPYHARDNMTLEDIDLAAAEISRFKSLGGGTLIDLSTRSIGPYPDKLAAVSSRTGINIVAGTGFYTKRAHPDYVKAETVTQLADRMIMDLEVGFEGSIVCAGVIGEIGSSSPIHNDEIKVLQASAEASKVTGAGINVHLAIFGQEGHLVLDILEKQGVSQTRVTLSHLDELPDDEYRLSLARRGCFIEFDCFGSEVYFDEENIREPSDAERIEALLKMIEAGFEKQLLLSQDVCTKMQLRQYGGMGYDHLLRTIVPRLKLRGVSEEQIDTMMVQNPARFLSGSTTPATI